MNQEKIGKFIYDLRKKYNLTQAELANRLCVTAQAVSKWENGRGVPDIELLKKLSEEFNVSIKELIEGEKEIKKRNKIFIFIPLLLIVIFLVIFILLLKNNDDSFIFSSLVCENDSFSINGVIAYNDKKKSVYISNISYCNEDVVEPKAVAVECILYEIIDGKEVEIAKYGSLNDVNNNEYISKKLRDVEFNIDDYNCGCNSNACNNLYIKIKALSIDSNVITYDIPISVDKTCSN